MRNGSPSLAPAWRRAPPRRLKPRTRRVRAGSRAMEEGYPAAGPPPHGPAAGAESASLTRHAAPGPACAEKPPYHVAFRVSITATPSKGWEEALKAPRFRFCLFGEHQVVTEAVDDAAAWKAAEELQFGGEASEGGSFPADEAEAVAACTGGRTWRRTFDGVDVNRDFAIRLNDQPVRARARGRAAGRGAPRPALTAPPPRPASPRLPSGRRRRGEAQLPGVDPCRHEVRAGTGIRPPSPRSCSAPLGPPVLTRAHAAPSWAGPASCARGRADRARGPGARSSHPRRGRAHGAWTRCRSWLLWTARCCGPRCTAS